MKPSLAYVALGSNLGDRESHLEFALQRLAGLPDTRVVAATPSEETMPLGGRDQPPYLNRMVLLETSLDPRQLLASLHEIEAQRGRVRGDRWASRTLDLDIVVFDEATADDPDLHLPHPGLSDREFWQRQLDELRRGTARS